MSKKTSIGKEHQRGKRTSRDYTSPSTAEGWSASRAAVAAQEKIRMARHFVSHDLFVREDQAPGDERKITAAKIMVNPGTTPNEVVKQVLEWIKTEVENNPDHAAAPNITWYTPGALVPATLRDFRCTYPHLRSSCGLHMFPGTVDSDLEMVRGDEAVRYARQLERWFTYALLSVYAFDMNTGAAFFFFDDEVELQRAIALREAEHKFLFLDPEKFKTEGSKAYSVRELLGTSRTVTIYTVSSKKDPTISDQFHGLANTLLDTNGKTGPISKTLRLVIVNKEKQVNIPVEGELRAERCEKTDG